METCKAIQQSKQLLEKSRKHNEKKQKQTTLLKNKSQAGISEQYSNIALSMVKMHHITC